MTLVIGASTTASLAAYLALLRGRPAEHHEDKCLDAAITRDEPAE